MEKLPSETKPPIQPVQPISKKQLKRMRRQEEWEAKKKDLRKKRKERIKEKKKLKHENQPQQKTEQSNEIHKTREERNAELIIKTQQGIKIIIDCDFEDLMNDKSINSMSRQIASCYSINRKAEIPFNLILYNVGPKLSEYLSKNHFENWIGVTVYLKGKFATFDDFLKTTLYKVNKDNEDELKEIKKKIYYLSADSENEIKTLDKDSTYIIGGIVDRNRYKGLSLNKAKELGINHGKFPIGEYIKLASSQVLTTNHTFAILNEFNIKGDWKEAFTTVIPKRKINDDNSEGEENEDKDA